MNPNQSLGTLRKLISAGMVDAARQHVASLEPLIDKLIGDELTRDKDLFFYSGTVTLAGSASEKFSVTLNISNDSFFVWVPQATYAIQLTSAGVRRADSVLTARPLLQFRCHITDTGLDRRLTDTSIAAGVHAAAIFTGDNIDGSGLRGALKPRICVPNSNLRFDGTYLGTPTASDTIDIVVGGYKIFDVSKSKLTL